MGIARVHVIDRSLIIATIVVALLVVMVALLLDGIEAAMLAVKWCGVAAALLLAIWWPAVIRVERRSQGSVGTRTMPSNDSGAGG